MEYNFNCKNEIALFNNLNQGQEKLTWFRCSIFAPVINFKYNLGINLSIEDIKTIGAKQIAENKLSSEFGGKGSDGVYAVLDFVKKNAKSRGWEVPNLAIFNNNENDLVLDWMERGYGIMIGIAVNKDFTKDVLPDGKIDLYNDYNKYKGNDLKHFTNIAKWKGRFEDINTQDYNKQYIIDSYAFNSKGNKWVYECDAEKVLNSFAMKTKYIFF